MNSAQARNWLRIGASLVPERELTVPFSLASRPASRWKLTQSPPSEARP